MTKVKYVQLSWPPAGLVTHEDVGSDGSSDSTSTAKKKKKGNPRRKKPPTDTNPTLDGWILPLDGSWCPWPTRSATNCPRVPVRSCSLFDEAGGGTCKKEACHACCHPTSFATAAVPYKIDDNKYCTVVHQKVEHFES